MRKPRRVDFIGPFIDEIHPLPLQEIVREVEEKLESVKATIAELKYTRNHDDMSLTLQFYHDLKALIFFLQENTPPPNIKPHRFKRFRWLAEKLVKRGEIQAVVLDLFPEI